METIRHVALGCCVISTIAGMIRVFWPKNGFSTVINAVLVLYIVTAGLQMLRGADWKQLTAELYHMPAAAENTCRTIQNTAAGWGGKFRRRQSGKRCKMPGSTVLYSWRTAASRWNWSMPVTVPGCRQSWRPSAGKPLIRS